MSNVEQALKIIKRGAVSLVQEADLIEKLKTGRPLRVKLGADPSAPDIHLGHAVVLKKLKDFQDLGHEIYFVVGDFTGRIGDPTGKSKTRPTLTPEAIRKNAETYKEQVFKILNPKQTKIVFNSTWSEPLTLSDILKLTAKTTVRQLLERDDFMKRYRARKPIALVEFFYPIMQALDSVEIKADVELGGTDQTFNLLFARDFQRAAKQPPQVILTVPLLVGLYGKEKMSKSLNNYIGLTDPPGDMYGKIMSIPDTLLSSYFNLLTDKSEADIKEMEMAIANDKANPRDYKMELARDIVTQYYDEAIAQASAHEFKNIFQKHGVPEEIPSLTIDEKDNSLITVMQATKLFKSNGEIRRFIKGGGVKLNGTPLLDEKAAVRLTEGAVLKIGKRHFFKLIPLKR
ncbi:tyrosine--tRNA ligase [Spirochaetota bacterium]|nr:tyrosine--tRNA ligase [Spirochaetota bacterium]